jgi:hypothetical protein
LYFPKIPKEIEHNEWDFFSTNPTVGVFYELELQQEQVIFRKLFIKQTFLISTTYSILIFGRTFRKFSIFYE